VTANVDAAYTTNGFSITGGSSTALTALLPLLDTDGSPLQLPAAGDTLWLHSYVYVLAALGATHRLGLAKISGTVSPSFVPLFSAYAPGSGNNIAAAYNSNATDNSVTITQLTITTVPANSVSTIDLSITGNGNNSYTLTLYVNGTATASTGTITMTQTLNSSYPLLGLVMQGYGNTHASATYSEVLVSKNQTTVGCRVAQRYASGAGDRADWSGSYASLSDLNDATVVTASGTGQKASFTMPALTVPSGMDIRAVVQNIRANYTSAPTPLSPMLLSGGVTEVDDPYPALTSAMASYHNVWPTMPLSQPWTQSGLNAAQFGFGT
jgi:hypothetical protein